MRPWIVWSAGLLAYVVAVLDRTTFGVAGLDAAARFDATPSELSMFVVLQLLVYAGAQIPAGLLLDRFGSKAMILAGGTLMLAGQLTMAVTTTLSLAVAARAVVGLGDAFTFISVLRLVPHWFPTRQVPLVSQLTGISGQLGQVLSAVAFLDVLGRSGWTVAFTAVAALGVVSLIVIALLVSNAPAAAGESAPEPVAAAPTPEPAGGVGAILRSVRTIWLRPGTRLGFFTHMGTQFSVTVFALMWGVPYLTAAQGVSREWAGFLLTVSVITAVAAGIVIGILTGRHPHRRSWLVLGSIAANAAVWTVVLALPGPAPHWLLIVLVVVISVGGPGSMIGFDFARSFNPRATLGTAQGAVNMGGFLASLLVMQVMGMVIGAAGGYSFDAFRLAWCVQYPMWALAVVGILITRTKARRSIGEVEESRYLLEFFDPRR